MRKNRVVIECTVIERGTRLIQMRTIKIKQGDIVEIPHPDGRRFVGWVVYVSVYFKNLMGVSIYGESPVIGDALKALTPLGLPLYTSTVAARQYGWVVRGYCDVTSQDLLRTARIVGGDVYVGDDPIRGVTETDRETLPDMMAMGMLAVYDTLTQMAHPAEGCLS